MLLTTESDPAYGLAKIEGERWYKKAVGRLVPIVTHQRRMSK